MYEAIAEAIDTLVSGARRKPMSRVGSVPLTAPAHAEAVTNGH